MLNARTTLAVVLAVTLFGTIISVTPATPVVIIFLITSRSAAKVDPSAEVAAVSEVF
jgi:hypothetical protein